MSLVKEFFVFLIHRKKYWLIPVLLISFLLIGLLVMSEGTVAAPFIYTLF